MKDPEVYSPRLLYHSVFTLCPNSRLQFNFGVTLYDCIKHFFFCLEKISPDFWVASSLNVMNYQAPPWDSSVIEPHMFGCRIRVLSQTVWSENFRSIHKNQTPCVKFLRCSQVLIISLACDEHTSGYHTKQDSNMWHGWIHAIALTTVTPIRSDIILP